MPQPCNSLRLVLTFERATPSASMISSACRGLGEMNRRACTCATVRLMPQRVPISPQWRMNFCWTGERLFISFVSVYTEITKCAVVCQLVFASAVSNWVSRGGASSASWHSPFPGNKPDFRGPNGDHSQAAEKLDNEFYLAALHWRRACS